MFNNEQNCLLSKELMCMCVIKDTIELEAKRTVNKKTIPVVVEISNEALKIL